MIKYTQNSEVSRSETTGRWRKITRGFAPGLIGVIALAALATLGAPRPAVAQSTLDPSDCQNYFFRQRLIATTTAELTPPPADLLALIGEHTAHVGLHLCPAVLQAPPDIRGVDSFTVDDPSGSSLDDDPPNPLQDDPVCYSTVPQAFTQARYINEEGSTFDWRPIRQIPTDWGGLGDPQLRHLGPVVDVRIFGGTPADDPETAGNESLKDAWETQGTADDSFLRIPIGRNQIIYRADTLMKPRDGVFVYVPAVGKVGDALAFAIDNSPVLQDAFAAEFLRQTGNSTITDENGVNNVKDVLDVDYRHGQLSLFDDVVANAFQEVWVLDQVPPVISTGTDVSVLPANQQVLLSYDAGLDTFYLEAIDPGGILGNTGRSIMRQLLDYSDRCGRQVSVTHNGAGGELWETGTTIALEWTATDPGPSNPQGDRNTASLTQTIEIRDSFPPVLLAPPSIVREIAPADPGQPEPTVDVRLGVPRVFDLANLTPELSNDWSNEDGSDPPFGLGLTEVTWEASDGFNTSTAVQLVNIKEEGTNTPPVADDQLVDTLSYAETEIVLTGSDGDYHPSVDRFDPLSFRITEPPQNGDFVAPLLPYFIDDVRLEASQQRFAGDTAQRDPVAHCASGPSVDPYQLEYPREPEWMGVADDGTAIVFDRGSIFCQPSSTDFLTRLAIFDPDSNLVEWQDLDYNDGGRSITDIFWDRRSDAIYIANRANEDVDRIEIYRGDLTLLVRYDLEAGPPATELNTPISVSVDSRGIMYVANNRQINAYAPLNRRPTMPGTVLNIDASQELLGIAWELPSGYFNIESIATDSDNNLYISTPRRVVKVSAAEYSAPRSFTAGLEIGWLGGCAGNLTTEVACDTPKQKSFGYTCTDALCGTPISGSDIGQFSSARGIAVDPNDNLYLADAGNLRVQRFTADGAFGGEARSTGVGYGFLLGDFGYPDDIEVNSDHFYLLDTDADLLHSFQTTPVTPIDDASARVTYRSDNNFIGMDQFRFSATDGFDTDEATVSISVTRNFRPPEIPGDGGPINGPVVLEDQSATFVLPATDPDGAQDTLSVIITKQPEHGSIEVDGLSVTYTPDPDYSGPDEFAYQVFDGNETSEASATVTLDVAPQPDAPTVVADTQEDASVGFSTQHLFAVTDPDADELFTFTIDWGDGETTGEGRFERNGMPIAIEDALDSNGNLLPGVEATGPIIGEPNNGVAISGAVHFYTMPGIYTVTTCVSDQVLLNPVSQLKTTTAASQTTCSETEVNVNLNAEVLIEVAGPDDPVQKGDNVEIVLQIRNLAFGLEPSDPRFAQLPSSGLDAMELELSGVLPIGLELVAVESSDASCSSVADGFSCAIALLQYATDAVITLSAEVTEAAPGGAELGITAEANWMGSSLTATGSGQVRVLPTGEAPTLDSLTPDSALVEDAPIATLQGSNFEIGSQVFFGAVAGIDVTVIDSTMLTVAVPNSPPGTVDVTVLNPDDQSATLAGGWTYLAEAVAPPPPPAPAPENPPRRGGGSPNPLTLMLVLVIAALSRGRLRRPRAGATLPAEDR